MEARKEWSCTSTGTCLNSRMILRSYQDLGADGYAVLEMILSPENITGVQQHGVRTRAPASFYLPAAAWTTTGGGYASDGVRESCDRKQSCHPSREPIA